MSEPSSTEDLLVACLCAAWCRTCGEFRDTFARLEKANAGARFVWLDVEDDAELLGDVEIENFPTLAVFRGGAPVFFGVTMPQEGVVARTLEALARGAPAPVAVPPEIAALPAALRERR
ncbi:MAG: thioredoxin family protein [Burkholderiales bacterium]|nr:thioredoxin family protein [Burkholderiales bacterium]